MASCHSPASSFTETLWLRLRNIECAHLNVALCSWERVTKKSETPLAKLRCDEEQLSWLHGGGLSLQIQIFAEPLCGSVLPVAACCNNNFLQSLLGRKGKPHD